MMLFLNQFGVTSPGFRQEVHARHSRQCCDMLCLFFKTRLVTALSDVFENKELVVIVQQD